VIGQLREARGWQDGTLPDPRLPGRAARPLALRQEQAQPPDRPDALRRGAGRHEVLRVSQVPQADRRVPRDTVCHPAGRQQPLLADEGAQSLGRSQVKLSLALGVSRVGGVSALATLALAKPRVAGLEY